MPAAPGAATMAGMTAPHQVALQRLSDEFGQLSQQMARVAGQLSELQRSLPLPVPPPLAPPVPPAPLPPPPVLAPVPAPPPPVYVPPPAPPRPPLAARLGTADGQGWIGKLLAVAGVAVTLIGVVLLLVLAAQAGILRPEVRVGAGAVLAAALVASGVRLYRRPGGQVGAIALAATGIAAAYMDVVAVTTIYGWLPGAGGLVLAALIGGGGLTLARRWDSQQLGLLVLVPLTILAPIVADGITLLLIGFMIALSAAALPVQLGKDWVWMHAARTAAVTLPLLAALFIASVAGELGSGDDVWLLGGACAIAALLAVLGALLLLPHAGNPTATALLTVAGALPALAAAVAVPRTLGALLAGALAAGLLVLVVMPRRLPGVEGAVVAIWSALSAVAALIAVTVAFAGHVEGPVLLGLALIVGLAGRRSRVARWVAAGFAVPGAMLYVAFAPPETLLRATELNAAVAVSTLISSVLAVAVALVLAWTWTGSGRLDADEARFTWAAAAVIALYSVTMFTVTAGVLVADDGGFLAGHMVATICWIGAAAALFGLARRLSGGEARTAPLLGGLALTAAATAKLFLFDLGTLDGMFRVAAFIVVGLVLLAMGANYARSLATTDEKATNSGAIKERLN
ncbi:putative membrane protein (DUF2339) [Mycolicibacterium chitae]|uniref:Putative membrane protein (DUF2339) n=2 Tax=Mycolicibacterium chitae TaxID=1792 RepID=A0A3S4VI90_MYCCI|nr:putative membrane protein (DUF2339) [Mycolicibacterium chitae]